MRRSIISSIATVVLVASASGCDGGGDVSATDPATTGTPTPPSTEPSTSTTTPPSEGLEKIRVVGEVVEVGDCVVVRDDNDLTWTIAGDLAPDLVSGDRVQVAGAPDLAAEGCGGPIVLATRITVLG